MTIVNLVATPNAMQYATRQFNIFCSQHNIPNTVNTSTVASHKYIVSEPGLTHLQTAEILSQSQYNAAVNLYSADCFVVVPYTAINELAVKYDAKMLAI